MADRRGIAEIFDTREDGLRCVRFVSGEVGVVDARGGVIYHVDKFKHIIPYAAKRGVKILFKGNKNDA